MFPTLLAFVLATVFWPPAAYLRRHRFAPALAAAVVVVIGIVVIAVLISLVASAVASTLPQIVSSVVTGVQSVREWIAGPPLNLADSQLTALIQQVTTRIQESVSTIAAGVLTGVGSIAAGVITFVLVLILTFLFVKDGPRFLPWVHKVAGPSAGGHLAEVLRRIWVTVGSFHPPAGRRQPGRRRAHRPRARHRGVPLALPLAVLTFLGGFIPIIGAFVAGAVAVLVALVNNGLAAGVTVLVIVVVVQQIEGNVLQSRGLGLHAAVVLLAITAGSTLYGIAGAFLAVPVTAAFAVVLRYLGEQIDVRTVPEPDEDLTVEHDPELGSAP